MQRQVAVAGPAPTDRHPGSALGNRLLLDPAEVVYDQWDLTPSMLPTSQVSTWLNAGSPAWRADLLWRDWLRADGAARSGCRDPSAVPRAGECAITRAEEWAASSGWTPSLEELPGP